jgi:hypothetical protein
MYVSIGSVQFFRFRVGSLNSELLAANDAVRSLSLLCKNAKQLIEGPGMAPSIRWCKFPSNYRLVQMHTFFYVPVCFPPLWISMDVLEIIDVHVTNT